MSIDWDPYRIDIDEPDQKNQVPTNFCEWHEDRDGYWDTTCDRSFVMTADTPLQNNYNFCPSCGKKLIEIPWSCDEWESTSPLTEMTDDDVEWFRGAMD